jgi:hypothetical protein
MFSTRMATWWLQSTLNASMTMKLSRAPGVWATARLNSGDEFRSLNPMVRGETAARREICENRFHLFTELCFGDIARVCIHFRAHFRHDRMFS